MSRYLIERIAATPNIELRPQTEITALEGDGGVLETIRLRNLKTGAETREAIRHLFLFIGAAPNTDWLAGSGIELEAKGFIVTGDAVGAGHDLETSLPGVFAIGDIRAGSVKRVAAAVGEGAQAVAAVHAYLSPDDLTARAVPPPARAAAEKELAQ
jgi:thioredoxin reductase (NADPH)